jgi:Tol biopolymer transport system component
MDTGNRGMMIVGDHMLNPRAHESIIPGPEATPPRIGGRMRRVMGRSIRCFSIAAIVLISAPAGWARQARPAPSIVVTVQEGTSMSVAVSPDGRTLAIDLQGGIWTLPAAGGAAKRVTGIYEDARQPTWSPDGKWIAFVSSRGNLGLGFGVWTVKPDGGDLRNLVARGLGAAWSPDGRWVYYIDAGSVYKMPAGGGPAVRVRAGPARNIAGSDGTTLYFIVDRTLTDGSPGFEIHAAAPEDAPSRVLATIPASRAPQWQIVNPSLSPDGASLAMPLTDGVTTNIWTLATDTGQWRQITNLGERPIFIARRVSWSSEGRAIFAAVGEGDSDIVMFDTRTRPD